MSLIRNVNVHDAIGNPIGSSVDALKISLYDGLGNPIESLKGALNIHDADVHNSIINKYIYQNTAVSTTLTAATAGDGTVYQISVLDATGFTEGSSLYINTSDIETTQPRLISTTAATGPAVFTLDRRLDIVHAIGDTVTQSVTDMSILVGTMVSPQVYSVGPQAGEVWHITRLLFSMTHNTAGDLGLFGNLAPLTNGVLLRAFVSGQYSTFANWKTSADIKDDMYDVEFDFRSGGGGIYGTSGRGTFKNAGSVIRLDGTLGDKLEVLVQDDITTLLRFTMKFQGHLENA